MSLVTFTQKSLGMYTYTIKKIKVLITIYLRLDPLAFKCLCVLSGELRNVYLCWFCCFCCSLLRSGDGCTQYMLPVHSAMHCVCKLFFCCLFICSKLCRPYNMHTCIVYLFLHTVTDVCIWITLSLSLLFFPKLIRYIHIFLIWPLAPIKHESLCPFLRFRRNTPEPL